VEASLLIHVVDASSPRASEEASQVQKVLAELGCQTTPQLLVLNKMDLLTMAAPRFAGGHLREVTVSALTGEGLAGLLAAIDEALPVDPLTLVTLRIPAATEPRSTCSTSGASDFAGLFGGILRSGRGDSRVPQAQAG